MGYIGPTQYTHARRQAPTAGSGPGRHPVTWYQIPAMLADIQRRCGKPMREFMYQTGRTCARPNGHTGPCRSPRSLKQRQDTHRIRRQANP
jgi:hypothetical protein